MEGAPPGHGAPGKAPVSRITALGLGFLALVIIAAMVPLSVLAHSNPLANAGTGLALGVPFGAVGLIVLRRQRNLIGWLSLASVVQKVLEPAHLSVWTTEGR